MNQNENNEKYMTLIEHINELRNRILAVFLVFIFSLSICLLYVKDISIILEKPAINIKFLQLAPGEYLFVSVKIAIYLAIIISSPFALYQILKFISPGLTKQESKYILSTSISSLILFFIGLLFCYKLLIPITLNFLINYGAEIIEPVWSFDEYFSFISLTLFTTGFCFQLPIVQIILGITNIVKWQKMLENWQYVIFISTVVSAIITPSTDPVTQIFMTITILILYFSGIFILKTIQSSKN
uniref:Sec-independent protein translocase component TatC n=1 Tax=Tolypiocladia glomerulata TaxID=860646 RepID=A0A1Z1MV60_9FLOR|nr:Sec-independent protein translocase component TatC [Tolypiocladia glomerulata]ARW69752.1 Sec-independent protein translocase component TatC [Tolypiocladia glomerulata]